MDTLKNLGYLSGGSRLKRIYERLQISGDKAYQEAGLDFKSSWFPVYYVLTQKDNQTVMEIAGQIAFSHITVKNILRELESNKLVSIKPHPKDKRSKCVSLTRKGKNLLIRLEPLWEGFSRVLKDVFEAGHPEMPEILNRIDAALEAEPLHVRLRKVLENQVDIRKADPQDYPAIGKLMVDVYSHLEGFPKPNEQPAYYEFLRRVGDLAQQSTTEIFAAYSGNNEILGAVVFFGDLQHYAAGNIAGIKDASGFRLLAVSEKARGKGIGKKLTMKCIERSRELCLSQLVIHTTKAMQIAWKMYESLGFERSEDIDFRQGDLEVFGFRLKLKA